MNVEQVTDRLHALANPEKVILKENKFGIRANNSLGIYHKDLKSLAKEIGQDNSLALQLYDTGIYEARILCSKIYQPEDISETQMNHWAGEFENWEVCDSFCMGFFVKNELALTKAMEWSIDEREFVKRAGFVIMAAYGFAHKQAGNEVFEDFFIPIEREAKDDRIYVMKAVNWALRNIGKRNIDLQQQALIVAERILGLQKKVASWIAKDAIRELRKESANVLDYPRSIYRPNL
jgi:3-methyladenine DNA glycosylase AlkD